MHKIISIAAAFSCIVAGPAFAVDAQKSTEPETTAKEASIPFASHGGVDDWRAVDSHTLLIKGVGKQWYKAELFSPCLSLKFADRIGFLVEPDGSLNRYSGIVVRDQVCRFKSLTKVEAPVSKKK